METLVEKYLENEGNRKLFLRAKEEYEKECKRIIRKKSKKPRKKNKCQRANARKRASARVTSGK